MEAPEWLTWHRVRIAINVALAIAFYLLGFVYNFISAVDTVLLIVIELVLPMRQVKVLGYYVWVAILKGYVPGRKALDGTAKESLGYKTKQGKTTPHSPLYVPKEFLDLKKLWRLTGADWAFSELVLRNEIEVKFDSSHATLGVDLRKQIYGVYNSIGKSFVQDGLGLQSASGPHRSKLHEEVDVLHESLMKYREHSEGDSVHRLSQKRWSFGLEHAPLRWASAGALPVVRWQRPKDDPAYDPELDKYPRWWFLLSFRDYRPVGLNLANGGSENEEEHTNIAKLALREYCEEVVILDDAPNPKANGQEINQKDFFFKFDDPHLSDKKRQKANKSYSFGKNHRKKREADGLKIELDEKNPIVVSRLDTPFRVQVDTGEKQDPFGDLIFSINAYDAGVECISLFCFELPPGCYPMHGEVSEWGYLLRRPFVLISKDYLEEVFGRQARLNGIGSLGRVLADARGIQYLGGKRLFGRRVDDIILRNDFHIFDADIDIGESRRGVLAERERNKKISVGEERELGFLRGKSDTSLNDQVFKEVRKLASNGDIDLSQYPDVLPFFTLTPVVWRTLEVAFGQGLFDQLGSVRF